MTADDSLQASSLIYLIGHIIGAFILLPVLLVYFILFDKHSCYGWSVIAMMVSFMAWYVSFAVVMGILSPLMESSPETYRNSDVSTVAMLACKRDS